jgi:hypothetical protein
MDLAQILELCQDSHLDEWRTIPGGEPGTDLLVGLVDAGTADEPALTALAHLYRAVYLPDARLGIGWGMESEEWQQSSRETRRLNFEPKPGWADEEWSDVFAQWAHILLNGTMVWRVRYAYVNRGAGMDGYMPWPKEDRDAVPDEPGASRRVGWSTTTWELSFAALLNGLQGNAWDFDVDRERRWKGILVRGGSPLDPP